MISTEKQFIFIHIPKTAGNSLTDILAPYSDHQVIIHGNSLGKDQGRNLENLPGLKHSPLSVLKDQIPHLDQYHKFCTVRNTWDRLISYASWELGKNPTAEAISAFLMHKKYKPQLHFIQIGGKLAIDTVLRFEHLAEDVKALCEKLKIPFPGLKIVNKSQHANYRTLYTKQARQWVAQYYAAEIQLFDFKF